MALPTDGLLQHLTVLNNDNSLAKIGFLVSFFLPLFVDINVAKENDCIMK